MGNKLFTLLKVRQFLPVFLTQFFGAFNDNLYKNVLVILITYQLASTLNVNAAILITVAAGLFILPFFLFSAPAGQLADKYNKTKLLQAIKLLEVLIMGLAAWGFYVDNLNLHMLVLFLLGTQATFFGPLKYAILPDLMPTNDLIAANALIESGTFIAILLGTIAGGILASTASPYTATLISFILLAIAICGYVASLYIPPTPARAEKLKININIFQSTWEIVRHTFKDKDLALAIFGISWFWLLGATYLSQFPTYVYSILNAKASIVTLLLTTFTLGIGLGSLFCYRLLKDKITATFVPLATLGMSIFAFDLVFASNHFITNDAEAQTFMQFMSQWSNWRIVIDLLLLSSCGGIYIVPLYTMLQHLSDPAYRSRAIAANNIINALFMVMASVITSALLYLHLSITQIFFVLAVANLFVAIYICNLLPEELVKSFLIWLLKSCYRVEVKGLANYYQAGERVLLISNHTSYLDAVLLAAFLPDRLTFAIDTTVAKKWWVRVMLKLVNTFSIDPANPLATKSIIDYIRTDRRLVIFPEGRITVTGSLMKIYEGPGLIADKAKARLLPIRIDGAQYTPLSYLKGKVKIRWFPKITISILEPREFILPPKITGRERRKIISAQLYDIMTDTIFLSSDINETLFQALLNAKSAHGGKHLIIEDIERKPMSYKRLILASIVLGRHITKKLPKDAYVGILLPNSIANVVTFFALQAFHRVPAMLNFTAGLNNLLHACKAADIKTIFTSRRFVTIAELQEVISGLQQAGLYIIYLEDVKAKINILQKLTGKFLSLAPNLYYHYVNNIKQIGFKALAQKPAVILFTSGSEGTPKGVALSHLNLQANRFQLSARVDFNPRDRIFNVLPMFHAFGLNSATLLPIIAGMRVFLYPSPLHYRIVPELCYDNGATIFFGTDTFLSNYGKYAHPYNFYSVRYVFAGAERIRPETKRLWMEKFGIRILEGYGATEAAPVITINTPMQYKAGTVGRLLPSMDYRLQTVPGIEDGSRLEIAGPNIMLGYLYSDKPKQIIPLQNGWHDTGDIVTMDDEGFITIKGRAKRFAKIAGEMVSLALVEDAIAQLWPEAQHAVVSVDDERKGEQIILLTNYKKAQLSEIVSHFKDLLLNEISLPRKIIISTQLPLLASGKVDYQAARQLAV